MINQDKSSYTFRPVGIVHSCFKQKFGIPRQPGLVSKAKATIEFFTDYKHPFLFEGLEVFSHIWVHFIFHQTIKEGWRPKVRPPRLGGKLKRGVFATRSTHRPNPLGMSVVKLDKIEKSTRHGVILHISGVDLLDKTPVVDIKPYLPYADKVSDATEQFSLKTPKRFDIIFSLSADTFLEKHMKKTGRDLKTLIIQTLEHDPRPGHMKHHEYRQFAIALYDANILWYVQNNEIIVNDVAYYYQTTTGIA